MSTGTIVAIVIVVIIVAALIAAAAVAARRRRLQQRFGPEYDRAVESSGSRLKADAELSRREKRIRHLDIRPLDPAARDAYGHQWTAIQQQFVDAPADAVTAAQGLITGVMSDRGYPTEDAAQILADLSVEHASTLEHFRAAQDLSGRAAGGTASTEDLRQAMVHYRTLFEELLGKRTETSARDIPIAPPTLIAPSTPPALATADERVVGGPEVTDPDGIAPVEADIPAEPATPVEPVAPAEPVSAPEAAVPVEAKRPDGTVSNGSHAADEDDDHEDSPALAGRLFRRR